MAWGIEFIHNQVRNILNQDNRFETPEVIDQNVNQAVSRIFNKLIGADSQTYQVGNPVSVRGGVQVNATNAAALIKLIETSTETVTTGSFDIPEDCVLILSIFSGNNELEWLKEGQVGKRLTSLIKPPTTEYPVWYYGASQSITVKPDTIASVNIKYIKNPETVVYGYTIDSNNGDYVFDPDTSVDVPFPQYMWDNIVNETLVLMGIPVQNQLAIQVANQQNNR